MSPFVRVIKLGGSLLDCPDVGKRFHNWLAGESAAVNLLVVGGGEIVEAVRQLDNIHRFPPAWSHSICIDLMQVTAKIAQQLLNCSLLATPEQLKHWLQPVSQLPLTSSCLPEAGNPSTIAAVVSPTAYFEHLQGLPEDWTVTSDSIAAQLARHLAADELCLLKSTSGDIDVVACGIIGTEPSEDNKIEQVISLPRDAAILKVWAAAGWVDASFPIIASKVARIRWINLRKVGQRERRY